MKTKTFHLGDVLTITSGRLLSPEGIGSVYSILNWMTGDSLFTHQLSRAGEECRPHLERQFPHLCGPDMQFDLAHLTELLDSPSGQADPKNLVEGWLCELTTRYGETFEVERIPGDDHAVIDPVEELEQMVGKEWVIVVREEDAP